MNRLRRSEIVEILTGLIGSVIGISLYWLGYNLGYKQGIRSGVLIRDLDPRIRHWWLKTK